MNSDELMLMISGRDFIFSNWALYLSTVHINPFFFLMNACLFSMAFKSSSLFLIKIVNFVDSESGFLF